ncbi:MAG: amidohydrolase family protein, partial [Myxococcota bacterium]
VYSTPPALIVAACRPGAAPASIHLGEDPAESAFTRSADGPFAALLDRIGAPRPRPTGASPVGVLDALGVLGPGLVLVHGVHLDDDDRARISVRRSPVCLCPRSNLHIGGVLPDVPALLAAGIRLALGTDSLASSPDLDVLGELPPLAVRYPGIPVDAWLALATSSGAAAVGRPGYGRIAVGAAPGLVLLHVDDPRDLLDAPPPRTWMVRP